MVSKEIIRKQMRSLGPESDPGSLWYRLSALHEFKDAGTVLLFWSIPGEPFSHDFISKVSSIKRVVLPRVVGETLELREYAGDTMIAGYRGIMEPGSRAAIVQPSEIDFAVVPGLAFDAKGRRLGRGKGYYDRLLPLLGCMKVGVCLESHFVGEVPVEKHDIPLDMVITPNNLYICKLLQ